MDSLENIINNKIQIANEYRIKLDIEDIFKRTNELREKIDKADNIRELKVLFTFVHDIQKEYNEIMNENKELFEIVCDKHLTLKKEKDALDIMLS